MNHVRPLFQSIMYLLSSAVGCCVPYGIALSITGSQKAAGYLLLFAAILTAPILAIVLCWCHCLRLRGIMSNLQDSNNLFHPRTSTAIPSLILLCGLIALQAGWSLVLLFNLVTLKAGWIFASEFRFATYGLMTVAHGLLLWRAYRSVYDQLITHARPGGTHLLTPGQRSHLLPIALTGAVVNLFAWSGIFLIYRGKILFGVLLITTLGPLLSLLMTGKLRRAAVLTGC